MKRTNAIGLLSILLLFLGLVNTFAETDYRVIYRTQKKLSELGYNTGVADGVWGKKTESALINFQRDNQLPMTGTIDEETKVKLGLRSPGEGISPEVTTDTAISDTPISEPLAEIENLNPSALFEQESPVDKPEELGAKVLKDKTPEFPRKVSPAPEKMEKSQAEETLPAIIEEDQAKERSTTIPDDTTDAPGRSIPPLIENKGTLVFVLSILGVVLSSVALCWNIYRAIRGRRRLRISCYIGKVAGGGESGASDRHFILNITNNGRKPVLLARIEGGYKEGEFTIIPNNPLPRMLHPGEFIFEYNSVDILKKDLQFLHVIDAEGRTYKTLRKQIRRLKKDYAPMEPHG